MTDPDTDMQTRGCGKPDGFLCSLFHERRQRAADRAGDIVSRSDEMKTTVRPPCPPTPECGYALGRHERSRLEGKQLHGALGKADVANDAEQRNST